jgi:hypothetical protein
VQSTPPKTCDSSPQQRQMRTCPLASTREQCGVGGRAFRELIPSVTEWSAARRKPIRAAALHLSAAISADVKARRLPTSQRRKFSSGNFRSARDFEGAEGINSRKARPPAPALSPFARKRGMSPLRLLADRQQPLAIEARRTGRPGNLLGLHAELGQRAAVRRADVRVVVVGRILLRFLERDDLEVLLLQ